MTFSVPSFWAAAISAARPPPSAAEVAAAQSPGLTDGDDDGEGGAVCPEDAGPADGESLGRAAPPLEAEQPAVPSASAAVPAMRSLTDNFIKYLRGRMASPASPRQSRRVTAAGTVVMRLRLRLFAMVARPASASQARAGHERAGE